MKNVTKKIFIILFILFFASVYSQQAEKQSYTTYRELSYSDFRNREHEKDTLLFRMIYEGKVLPIEPLTLEYLNTITTPIALSHLSFTYVDKSYGGYLYFYCASLFYFDHSHMIIKIPPVLLHEQIHFDILELMTRRLKRELNIKDGQFTCHDSINALVSRYKIADSVQQELFDDKCELDTTVSFLINFQTHIRRQLDSLKDFAAPKGFIKFETR